MSSTVDALLDLANVIGTLTADVSAISDRDWMDIPIDVSAQMIALLTEAERTADLIAERLGTGMDDTKEVPQ